MTFNNNSPICVQITNAFRRQIAAGTLAPGSKIAAVHDLAFSWSINPDTMRKALDALEADNMIRVSGGLRYVTDDADVIADTRAKMLRELTDKFIEDVRAIGCSPEDVSIKTHNEEEQA